MKTDTSKWPYHRCTIRFPTSNLFRLQSSIVLQPFQDILKRTEVPKPSNYVSGVNAINGALAV